MARSVATRRTWPEPGDVPQPRIGIVNLMPHAADYEDVLLSQFAASRPFEPVWIRVRGRSYSLDDPDRIRRRYRLLAEAVDEGPLAGLVVTGAAVEHLPFSAVRFLDEVAEGTGYARERGAPVLGLCWGALAVGHLTSGLPHTVHRRKVSGVFETELQARDSVIGRGFDDRFWSAHSRYAGFDEDAVAAAAAAGRLRVVASSCRAGTVIAETPDAGAVMHVGHPEYGAGRLAEEYRRDVALGVAGVQPPDNVDLDRPVCLWRSHSRIFFANWIGLVHERLSASTSSLRARAERRGTRCAPC